MNEKTLDGVTVQPVLQSTLGLSVPEVFPNKESVKERSIIVFLTVTEEGYLSCLKVEPPTAGVRDGR